MLLTLLGIGSLEYPLTSGVAAVLFSFSKIVGNVFGYSRGRSSAKNRGAFGYLGLLTLVGRWLNMYHSDLQFSLVLHHIFLTKRGLTSILSNFPFGLSPK